MQYMKQIIILYFLLSPLYIFAQMPMSYSYDASGNRVSKQAVVIAPMAAAGRKSSPSSGKIAGSISGDVSIKGSPDGNTITVLLSTENDKGSYDIFLYNLSGKVLQKRAAARGNISVSLSSLPVGSYILSVSDGSNHREWKITKNR